MVLSHTTKKRSIITTTLILATLALIATALRSRGYLYSKPDILSVSPDTRKVARLYQLNRMIDKNYRITVRDTKRNTLIAEYITPDEMALNDSVHFQWNPDSTAVLLVGDVFATNPTFNCEPNAYLLIDMAKSNQLWSAASQDPASQRLTEVILTQFHFCERE